MNILFIKNVVVVGFMVFEIQRVSVFGHYPYSVTFPYIILLLLFCYLYCYFILQSPLIPSRNLDEVFTYSYLHI